MTMMPGMRDAGRVAEALNHGDFCQLPSYPLGHLLGTTLLGSSKPEKGDLD
jgi:hypothetical protein